MKAKMIQNAKSTNLLFKYAQLIILLTMITTVVLGFIFPISLFQSLVILPVLLLLQIGLLAYLEIKLDSVDKTAQIHCLLKRIPINFKDSKKAA